MLAACVKLVHGCNLCWYPILTDTMSESERDMAWFFGKKHQESNVRDEFYRLRSLGWEWDSYSESWTARTPFGSYRVKGNKWRVAFSIGDGTEVLLASGDCCSLEDGKNKSWDHWCDMLRSEVLIQLRIVPYF